MVACLKSFARSTAIRSSTTASTSITRQSLARYSSFPPRAQRPSSPPDYDTSHSPPSPAKGPWEDTSSAPPGKARLSASRKKKDENIDKTRWRWAGYSIVGLVGIYYLFGRPSSEKAAEQSALKRAS